MTESEYNEIQQRLTSKMKDSVRYSTMTRREKEAFDKGVLASKSIVKELYERWNKLGPYK